MSEPPYTPPPPPPPPPYTPQPVPPAAPPPQKSGCLKWALIGCGAVFVLFVAFCAVLVFFVFGAMKRSTVYKGAVAKAQSDPRVVAALGSPVEADWWVKGNVSLDDRGGNAELTIPLHGPKAKAIERAAATYDGSNWKYETLTVTPEGGAPIDLNTPP